LSHRPMRRTRTHFLRFNDRGDDWSAAQMGAKKLGRIQLPRQVYVTV
jgi:hypothetical protein